MIGGAKPAWGIYRFQYLMTQYFFDVYILFSCYSLILYQKVARNHCKSNVKALLWMLFNALFKYREVPINIQRSVGNNWIGILLMSLIAIIFDFEGGNDFFLQEH